MDTRRSEVKRTGGDGLADSSRDEAEEVEVLKNKMSKMKMKEFKMCVWWLMVVLCVATAPHIVFPQITSPSGENIIFKNH